LVKTVQKFFKTHLGGHLGPEIRAWGAGLIGLVGLVGLGGLLCLLDNTDIVSADRREPSRGEGTQVVGGGG
jgi:hypothetical protein